MDISPTLLLITVTNFKYLIYFWFIFLKKKIFSFDYGITTLSEILNIRKKFPEEEIYEFALEICETLKNLKFKANICHNDIKLENFILHEDGTKFQLSDFGLAKIL